MSFSGSGRKWWRMALVALMSVAFATVIACGGDAEEPAATNTPQPANTPTPSGDDPTATPTGDPDPTATPEPAATTAPTATPTPDGSGAEPGELTGNLTVATNSVGVPVGTPQFCVPGCGNEKYLMGAWDTLVRATVDQQAVPHVADWEFADDLSSITWNIREGIQFHQGYGELTAEDVAFSLNTTNAATNPDSIHDNAGDFSGNYGETTVVDTYTARTEITNYDSRAPLFLFSDFWQGIAISSKAVFDEHGPEGMRTVFVGTGPFEVVEWQQNDQASLKGVANHWHKTPSVETARLVEAPEPSIRRAMFESGEAQMTRVELSDLPNVEEAYPTGRRTVMNQQQFISLGAGNYLETTNVKTGEPLESPGFDPSLAWVGDPDAEGCDRENLFGSATPANPPCESMENARKVREAMAITIPRADVNEALYAGSGFPSEIWDISSNDPFFKEEWSWGDVDVERARQLLDEAGWGDGFDVVIDAGTSQAALEFPQTLSSVWSRDLGINVQFNQQDYATQRPTYVDRSNTNLVTGGAPLGWPLDWPHGREDNSWFAGGTMKYGALPYSAEIYGEMLKEPDPQTRLDMAEQWFEHQRYWAWTPAVVETPVIDIYRSDLVEWEPERQTSIWWGGVAVSHPLDDVVMK